MSPNTTEVTVAPSVREGNADGARCYSAHVLEGLSPSLPGWAECAQAISLPIIVCLYQNGYVRRVRTYNVKTYLSVLGFAFSQRSW